MLSLYAHCRNAAAALEKRFLRDVTGQTMVEYVMLIVLVALAVFMLTPNIKSAIITVFSNTSSALKTGSGS
jgi:Flp pilus assembly pilin Flp